MAAPHAFHPATLAWLERQHGQATAPQREGWPHIARGKNTLIAAPTGTGKTLAGFLAAIDRLVWQAQREPLAAEVQVLYVSPLKALSNDIARNLEEPLAGIELELESLGLAPARIRTGLRTGDTKSSERTALTKRPPHILVTTPESLYILLTSDGGRRSLQTVRCVIVDEIHALLPNKRGAHLSLSLERLQALTSQPLQRIGLSATQKPLETVARFLIGQASPDEPAREVAIVDCGHRRDMDLALEVPPSPLEAVMSAEVWGEVYDRLAELVQEHTTTLVFVGNRRLSERLCKQLGERLGEDVVAAHHGSLSKELRLSAEQRLKAGKLRALVATASLELGIDIGAVDLVCQVGSPRAISTWLQRVGRAGHYLEGVPRGRLFPLSRNDLLECTALLASTRAGELDAVHTPCAPLDILAQQIVASVASEGWDEEELLRMIQRSHCYAALSRAEFEAVLDMLTQGFNTARGRRAALVRRDPVVRDVQGKRAARLVAITSGGAIADNADYRVVLDPENTHVGSVHEDFAVEAMAGDIFQLGNTSWRILKVETGVVRVADARGQPPNIPFWLGEAPARSNELSQAVSRLLGFVADEIAQRDGSTAPSGGKLVEKLAEDIASEYQLSASASRQIADYLLAAQRCLSALPTRRRIVVERFFDEAQNTHIVFHSPLGARINRAWGLALRKRFCRSFNFELQAAANEDALILSLGPTHSFELSDVGRFLRSQSAHDVLVQALLDAPMFEIRWRHNVARALATPRFAGGKKVPAHLMRIRADDLLATAFPDQQACLENLSGEREIPDHPLVQQTIRDCLTEAMDVDGFLRLLTEIESGETQLVFRDLTEPSPLAQEILNANPYAFLDPAPLEERRTQAVATRRFFDPTKSSDLGRLDANAIERVRQQAWPDATDPDELCEALALAGFTTDAEARQRYTYDWLNQLCRQGRATRVEHESGLRWWVAAERLPAVRAALNPAAQETPVLSLPNQLRSPVDRQEAVLQLVRARLSCLGPIGRDELLASFGHSVPWSALQQALTHLESCGEIMAGRFLPELGEQPQWCERGLLARIHRYTLERLRSEIEPVSPAALMRFLLQWQHIAEGAQLQGAQGLATAIEQLAGVEAAAGAWEAALLPVRVRNYAPFDLDQLCQSGLVTWGRVSRPVAGRAARTLAMTPIAVAPRDSFVWHSLLEANEASNTTSFSAPARRIHQALVERGPRFRNELRRLLPTESELDDGLSELVAAGAIHSDSFAGLRGLLPRPRNAHRKRRRTPLASPLQMAGRWSLLSGEPVPTCDGGPSPVERWARLLLRRYGVVFRSLLERENAPPWGELLHELRRLESRGEVRGGRFVTRMAGEQFALPEAVPLLRKQRNPQAAAVVWLSAADPLNLVGSILAGRRIPAVGNNALLLRDGSLLARLEAGSVDFETEIAAAERHRLATVLLTGSQARVEAAEPAA